MEKSRGGGGAQPLNRRQRKEARLMRRTQPGYIPAFLKPCKVLIRNMKPIISEKAPAFKHKPLVDLIRCELRKTLASLLENQDHMPSVQIVKLYRDYYPKSTDVEVVVRNLEKLRASPWLLNNSKPGNANPQSKHINKAKTMAQTNFDTTGAPTKPVTNTKQEPQENIAKKTKVEANSKVQEIPKEQIKNDHNESNSTADDDWIDYSLDPDESEASDE